MIAAPPFWDLIPAQSGALPLAGDWNSLTSGSVTVMPLASFLSARGVLLVNQLTARRQLFPPARRPGKSSATESTTGAISPTCGGRAPERASASMAPVTLILSERVVARAGLDGRTGCAAHAEVMGLAQAPRQPVRLHDPGDLFRPGHNDRGSSPAGPSPRARTSCCPGGRCRPG